jgi:chain length determinant protein (polysaccharide antigen chain regulator)
MNQDNNTTIKNRRGDSDETIDLIDILVQLKKGKFTIIAFVIIAAIIAAVYVFSVKEKWTSSAIVTYPDSGQLAAYTNAIGVLYSQNPSNMPSNTDIQQRFFGRFNSAISALSGQLNNQQNPEKLIVSALNRDQSVPVKISYTANTAADAQKTLTTYIQQINTRVVTELNNDMQTTVDSKITDLKGYLNTKKEVAQEEKNERLQVLNQALITAKQSNIKNTVVQQAETLSEDTLFVLGSDALTSIIKNESTRPLPLDNSYYNARQLLLAVTALKDNPVTTYSLRYIMKPDLPVRKDSPKKGMTILLGVLVGLILGSFVVLGRNILKDHASK